MGLSDISLMVLLITPMVPLAHPPCGQDIERVISENTPNRTGAVLRVAIFDHCLPVSMPRRLRTSSYCALPPDEPGNDRLRIATKIGA
jgi:hypothetical protein